MSLFWLSVVFAVSVAWGELQAAPASPRAIASAPATVWEHPAAAAELPAAEGVLRYDNSNGHDGDFSFYLPIDTRTAGYLGFANKNQFNLGSVIRLYSGTWVGVRGEFVNRDSEQSLDFSLGAYYRPSTHLALAWDVRRILETAAPHASAPETRLFGVGGALFFDRQEWVALHGDIAVPGFSGSELQDFEAGGGFRICVGDTARIILDGGVLVKSVPGYTPKALDAYWKILLGIPVFQHRLEASVGADDYKIKGPDHKPSLQIGLGFVYEALRDRTPPAVSVQLDSGKTFLLHVKDNGGRILDWQLLMHRADSSFKPQYLVRRYAGQGDPPDRLELDGRDLRGEPLPPGLYAYRLLARDPEENATWSSWQFVVLP